MINGVIPLEPTNVFSSLLRICSQIYQWTWKRQPLMLRSTELSTLAMTSCRAMGSNLSIKAGNSVAV